MLRFRFCGRDLVLWGVNIINLSAGEGAGVLGGQGVALAGLVELELVVGVVLGRAIVEGSPLQDVLFLQGEFLWLALGVQTSVNLDGDLLRGDLLLGSNLFP